VSGDVGFFPIISAPPYITSTEPTSVIKLEGKSVNLDRQESAHAHQAFLTETNELLVPDLGSDKVRRFVKNDIGKWVPNGDISYDAGGGPRHVAISGKLSLLSSVDSYSFIVKRGTSILCLS
jgi:6-phosphogluconolactonase (cycloisomerase 2 family)